MTWAEWHTASEKFAVAAEQAAGDGDLDSAQALYVSAAEAEARALADLDRSKQRTFGVTVVSAVALWYKANRYQEALRLAHQSLAGPDLPPFAIDQLEFLVQSAWNARARSSSGVRFRGNEVLVGVKGGQVIAGGAPLDLVVARVETVRALFYRTAEWLAGMQYRRRGSPPPAVQNICQPWLFQTVPGSYQFVVAVEEPQQLPLIPDQSTPSATTIADTFLQLLRASAEAPESQLAEMVTDRDYRKTFIDLTRSLAPSGDRFTHCEIRAANDLRTTPVTLGVNSRVVMTDALKALRPAAPDEAPEHVRGTLRGVQLDDDWLDVSTPTGTVHIVGASEAVDDVVGPLVNKPVIVEVVRRGDRRTYRDIQSVE
jgi:hypothetical protein